MTAPSPGDVSATQIPVDRFIVDPVDPAAKKPRVFCKMDRMIENQSWTVQDAAATFKIDGLA